MNIEMKNTRKEIWFDSKNLNIFSFFVSAIIFAFVQLFFLPVFPNLSFSSLLVSTNINIYRININNIIEKLSALDTKTEPNPGMTTGFPPIITDFLPYLHYFSISNHLLFGWHH